MSVSRKGLHYSQKSPYYALKNNAYFLLLYQLQTNVDGYTVPLELRSIYYVQFRSYTTQIR